MINRVETHAESRHLTLGLIFARTLYGLVPTLGSALMQWRYWRWQVVRTLPLIVVVFALVAAAGLGALRVMPQQQTAVSRVVLETPLALRETPRAARSAQDVQHLQVVIHTALSQDSLADVAHTLSLPPKDVTRDTVTARIQSGRDKPTNLVIEAHAPTAAAARALAASATQVAIETSNSLQRERVEASLKNLQALVAQQADAVADAKAALAAHDAVDMQTVSATLDALRAQEYALEAQIAGRAKTVTKENPALAALRRELATAKGIYSDRHPKVRLLMSRMAQLEPDKAAVNSTDATALAAKLAQVRQQASAARTSQLAYAATSKLLDDAEQRLASAQHALNEARLRGERSVARLRVVEDATLTTASRRNKQLAIMLILALAATSLAVGSAVLRIRLDRRLRRPADLSRSLGLTPFATLPHLGPQLS